MSHRSARSSVPIILRLPGGERYRVEVDAADLTGRLAPGRKAPRELGLTPVLVEVRHPGGQYLVPVSAGELTRLLSRARLIDDAPAGRAVPRAQNIPGRGGPTDQPADVPGPAADERSSLLRRHHRPP